MRNFNVSTRNHTYSNSDDKCRYVTESETHLYKEMMEVFAVIVCGLAIVLVSANQLTIVFLCNRIPQVEREAFPVYKTCKGTIYHWINNRRRYFVTCEAVKSNHIVVERSEGCGVATVDCKLDGPQKQDCKEKNYGTLHICLLVFLGSLHEEKKSCLKFF